MKATARAPANIALIKYWGKQNEELRLPLNSSISINLSNCHTITTVKFSPKYKQELVEIRDYSSSERSESRSHWTSSGLSSRQARTVIHVNFKEERRVVGHLERIRKLAKIHLKAKVVSKNSFPSSAGIAASASGFAALTLAATKAAGLSLSEKELSILARLGSGSACRSIPDGFVEWQQAKTSQESYAYSLCPPDYWDLRDIIAIVQKQEKKISSTKGMEKVFTSPFLKARLKEMKNKIEKIKKALKEKDFRLLGEVTEEEAINIHCVMMTQKPPLFYWSELTIKIIKAVCQWREKGLPIYFTIDAGSNVHLICQAKDEKEVVKKLKKINGVLDVIINKPAQGARLINEHLF